MNQVLHDHLPFIIAGILIAAVIFSIPRQTRWGRRLSVIIGALAFGYPTIIWLLYLFRNDLGESYAYLFYGWLTGITAGAMGGIALVAWLIVWLSTRNPAK